MSIKLENTIDTRQRHVFFQVSALLIISVAVYANTLRYDFVFDDNAQLFQNPWITDFRYIPTIFKSNVWGFDGSVSNYYRPMMHLIYMLGYHFFGYAPWGYHLINVLLNTAACLLVYAVTGRLLKGQGGELGDAPYIPLLTAVIFAVHPIHTEAVAWVASVPDLSYALFYLAAFYFYIVSRDGIARAGWAVLLSAASFFVALLCKEPAVTLPALLFGYDYALMRRKDGPAGYLKSYLPYGLVFALYLVMRISALGGFSPVRAGLALGPYHVAINILPLFGQYIGKLLLPVRLNVSYPFHPVASLLEPAALAATAVSAALLAALLVSLWKRSIWAIGLMFIAVPLLPALYIPGMGKSIFGERYLYLPVFGFAFLVCLVYVRAAARMPGLRKTLGVSMAALITVYAAGTVNSNRAWADDMSLWSHSISVSPDNPFPHTALGEVYFDDGLVDKAMKEYIAAIRLDAVDARAHAGLGSVYVEKGELDKALQESEFAVARAGGSTYVQARAHCNIGAVYARRGELDKAADELEQTIELAPVMADAHSNLGYVYGLKGRTEEAVQHCRKAVELGPKVLGFRINLGIAYSMAGRYTEALEQFSFVLKANPAFPDAHNNLGITYAKMGRKDMAIGEFEAALRLDPDNALLRENLRRAEASR